MSIMNNLLNEFKIKEQKKDYSISRFVENILTRLKTVFAGKDPHVYSFVIISPEDPENKKLINSENMKRKDSFKRYMDRAHLTYIPFSYGLYFKIKSDSYIVFNIDLKVAMALAGGFQQESFIYTKKDLSHGGDYAFSNYVIAPSKEYIKRDTVYGYELFGNNIDDFFTRLKSFKFSIPLKNWEINISELPPEQQMEKDWAEIYTSLSPENKNQINSLNKKIVYEMNEYTMQGKWYKMSGIIQILEKAKKIK